MSDVRRPGAAVLPSGLNTFLAIDQSALDAIPTGLCVCGADGVLLKYNQRAVELWGRAPRLNDPAELDGGAFRRYAADGSTLPFAASPVAAALRTGATLLGAELTIERPGGSRVPVLMNVAPLQNPASHVEGAVCSFQEFTECKRAEEALRASEAELQTVINQTPFMLVRCSRDLRYRFISQAYARWIGHPRDEVLGTTIAETIGEQGFQTLRPHIVKVLQGTPVEFECEIDFREVGRRCLLIAYRPELDTNGNVDGWIASLLDVTERKRTEAELRNLSQELGAEVERRTLERDRIWNVSEDLLAVGNFNGYFLSMNPAWTRLLGWSEDEIKSMHVNELRHPDDAAARGSRAHAARARRSHGAHGKSIPPQGRQLALAAMDDDGKRRPASMSSAVTSPPSRRPPRRSSKRSGAPRIYRKWRRSASSLAASPTISTIS